MPHQVGKGWEREGRARRKSASLASSGARTDDFSGRWQRGIVAATVEKAKYLFSRTFGERTTAENTASRARRLGLRRRHQRRSNFSRSFTANGPQLKPYERCLLQRATPSDPGPAGSQPLTPTPNSAQQPHNLPYPQHSPPDASTSPSPRHPPPIPRCSATYSSPPPSPY